ncbi:MAG: cytochrome c biogenesis protein CcsA [Leptospiraceae bacterium]|nr:cytochrome c biogenesis protein CcsA [Leptospiraceae bacterium]
MQTIDYRPTLPVIKGLFWALLVLQSGLYTHCSNSSADIGQKLAKVPVLHEGRIKPLDTFARVHLLAFYGRSTLPGISPMDWLLELLLNPQSAYNRPVFKLRNQDTVAALKLPSKDKMVYSFAELSGGMRESYEDIQRLFRLQQKDLSPVQSEMLRTYQAAMVYYEISRSLSLILPEYEIKTERLARELQLPQNTGLTYMQVFGKERQIQNLAQKLIHKDPNTFSSYDLDLLTIGQHLQFMQSDAQTEILRIVPPLWQDDGDVWYSPWAVVQRGRGSAQSARYLDLWHNLAIAWRSQDQQQLTTSAAALQELAGEITERQVNHSRLLLEYYYSLLDFFTWSLVFYVAAFLLLLASWITQPERLYRASWYTLLIAFILHTIGLLFRVYIMERPPVSTLYESILFVGFIAVAGGLYLEKIKSNATGIMLGSVMGAALQFVGLGYAADGDSMGMLVAVLNTNFWLATHVVTITIGYGTSFVGGFLGHVYLVRRFWQPEKKEELNDLYNTMIGVSLVALFFAMFGTILGGIWADQSWGRFWGWDPKENGALLICLWLLIALHGRLSGYFKAIGYALAMVFTNIIVALAWFGVNLLNIGLHSYGFTDSIALNLLLFCSAELMFMAVLYIMIQYKLERRPG